MSLDKQKIFKLFANCIIVEGNQRALICDLQNGENHFVPLELVDLLKNEENKTIEEYSLIYDNSSFTEISKYFNYFIEQRIAFIIDKDEVEMFPPLNLEWHFPGHISNAIIEADNLANEEFEKIIKELDALGCKSIEVRFYKIKDIQLLDGFFGATKDSRLKSIDLILPYQLNTTLDEYKDLVLKNKRLVKVLITSSNEDKTVSLSNVHHIIYSSQKIGDNSCCGFISKNYFSTNIFLFTESQHHNTCLNRKIAIDTEGNIKNCPSMQETFGNIKDTTLTEILKQPKFKKKWNITKDQISVCQDCEFRHICTDCRAYLENPEDIYSKPLKCGYNPYTCEWEEWSTNPLKEKGIKYYGMGELVEG